MENDEDTPYTIEGSDVVNKPIEGMEQCPEPGCTAKVHKGFFYRNLDNGEMKEISYLEYHLEKDHGKNIEKNEE